MTMTRRLLPLLCAPLLLTLACDDPSDGGGGDEVNEGDTSSQDETDEGTDDSALLDTDEDGLTDIEEAEIGTDPNVKDTDDDGYWDSWEVWEGTDPLDPASKIYTGDWPYNPDKDDLEQGSFGSATTQVGSKFPRATFIDHWGEEVDNYDFANHIPQEGAQPSYFIVDMSAMWCGPCHNMADWIAGVDNANTADFQALYPTVREKVASKRIWWWTFIVENAGGGNAALTDAQSWYQQHTDDHIPIFVDEGKQVLNIYNGGQFPFLFLLDPELGVEYWAIPQQGENPFMALWFIEQYL